jgi:hypothetical protein
MPGGNVVVSDYKAPPMYLRDVFTTPLTPRQYSDVKGSPFLFDDFLIASIQLPDDRIVDSVKLRLNAYENKIHFIDDRGEEMQAAIAVKTIVITDNKNSAWQGVVFRSGFAGAGNSFYQVIADGTKMQLLKKLTVNMDVSRALGEQNSKTFETEEELCFAINGALFIGNKKCSLVTDGFAEYKEKLQQFISENNIKCNKQEDMKKLVKYCNSL